MVPLIKISTMSPHLKKKRTGAWYGWIDGIGKRKNICTPFTSLKDASTSLFLSGEEGQNIELNEKKNKNIHVWFHHHNLATYSADECLAIGQYCDIF